MSDPIARLVQLDAAMMEVWSRSIESTRAAERLHSLGPHLSAILAILESVAEVDPELEPELRAMVDSTADILEAGKRASAFLAARLEIQTAAAMAPFLHDDEGGTP